ncbi:MAG: A24 family peptidase [Myxococcota bacterium]|nr:A24 family peptidase [Myxococcota bacterium]
MTSADWSIIALCVGLTIGCWTDVKHRRVPNVLTLPMLGVGLTMAALGFGRHDVWISLQSVMVAFAVMLVPFAMRLYKGGDLKLVVASAAWLTPMESISAILLGIAFGGVLGVVRLGLDRVAWRQLGATLFVLILGRYRPGRDLAIDAADGTVAMALAFSASVMLTVQVGVLWQ